DECDSQQLPEFPLAPPNGGLPPAPKAPPAFDAPPAEDAPPAAGLPPTPVSHMAPQDSAASAHNPSQVMLQQKGSALQTQSWTNRWSHPVELCGSQQLEMPTAPPLPPAPPDAAPPAPGAPPEFGA